jgi:hypothetical protein
LIDVTTLFLSILYHPFIIGNQSVHNKICPAGWGVVILHVPEGECEKNARLVTELYGPVILDSENDYYLGATVGICFSKKKNT